MCACAFINIKFSCVILKYIYATAAISVSALYYTAARVFVRVTIHMPFLLLPLPSLICRNANIKYNTVKQLPAQKRAQVFSTFESHSSLCAFTARQCQAACLPTQTPESASKSVVFIVFFFCEKAKAAFANEMAKLLFCCFVVLLILFTTL